MKASLLCIASVLILVSLVLCSGEPTVQISNGVVTGQSVSFDGKQINQFLGIPYAQPPTGSLRFKKPLPTKTWPETLEATKWPKPCYQNHPFPDVFRNKEFSEDCLYLNIWSPEDSAASSDNGKAVMFWIHGGALFFGSSVEDYFSGHVLAAKGDVVVVTINYRVNTFGFLYTGTDDAPGNVGLWDQNLALEWVNDNIRYFGGDPKRITIFGESAGSWSTSLHVLSPVSRNLFQNAIMMSGAAINRIAGEEPKYVLKNWIKGAKAIRCADETDTEFTADIIKCLQEAPAKDLAGISLNPKVVKGIVGWMSQVVIDKDFLPDRPLAMLRSGDYKQNINLMVGTTEDEGSFVITFYVDPHKYPQNNPPNITLDEAIDDLSRISSALYSKEPVDGQEVSRLYFTGLSDQSGSDLLRRTIGIAIGDYLLGCPAIQFGKEVLVNGGANKNRVYQYYYTSKIGAEEPLCAAWMGACHFDDVFPVFGVPFYQPDKFVDGERDVSETMIKIFTNFAKTGRPDADDGHQWPHYYRLNGHTVAPYREISHRSKGSADYGLGLKINECEYLWKKYIDQH